MTGIARDTAEEGSFDSTRAMATTPSTSPGSSLLGSPATGTLDGGGVLDGSFTSLSGNTSTVDVDEEKHALFDSPSTIRNDLREAFAENILAKSCKVAVEALRRGAGPEAGDPRDRHAAVFPEYCPQTAGDDYGRYILREPEFWTCGFFPGTLFTLLERVMRFPQSLEYPSGPERPSIPEIRSHLLSLCRAWSEPLHAMADRTDTHDIGFIIMPALRLDWELTANERSLASILRAAHSLASRYVPTAHAIRSWDLVRKKDLEITDMATNLILIIDSMCNLDLLYYAAAQSGNPHLADIATAHARTLLTTHLRPVEEPTPSRKPSDPRSYTGPLFSTCHVANLDPATGTLKQRATAQGYSHTSCWARGQSWAILGYAQTYTWTSDPAFLRAACGCAEYFLQRLETAPACVDVEVNGEDGDGEVRKVGRYVPLWDFDAPIEDVANPTRDSSAGVIAANGMLVLSQALVGIGETRLAARFREAAVTIVRDTLDFALAREKVRFVKKPGVVGEDDSGLVAEDVVPGSQFDALLKFGTANNNTFANKRYANHGLVYGDYYLVEFGNRLLRMGLA